MPWLPLYATDPDLGLLLRWLNQDEDIAFLLATGPGRWQARRRLGALTPGRYALWHLPSGPLPLAPLNPASPAGTVADPWSGWQEGRAGAAAGVPALPPEYPGVIYLVVREPHAANQLPICSFEWAGGQRESPAAHWWQRLRRRLEEVAEAVPLGGPAEEGQPEVLALPKARVRFAQGAVGAARV